MAAILKKNILLVEDDPKLSFVLKTLLEERGCDVTVCHSAAEARQLNHNGVDVAVLDVRLPLELGTELAEHLRTKHGRLKIIFVTGYDDLERSKPAIDHAALLVKPFSFDALWALL